MVSGRFTFRIAASALVVLGALHAAALPVPVAAAPAPAGVIIESTAEATYADAGVIRTINSNTVQVRVDELLGVAAASVDAGPVIARPGTAVLTFEASNIGNGPEAIALEVVTAVAGNAFDTALESIATDTNGNGVYDPGIDTILANPSVTVSLPAGESETIFVILTVPAGMADGAQSTVNLIARTATGTGAPGTLLAAAGEGGTDAIIGLSGGMAVATGELVASVSTVTLIKSASVADPFGGSTPLPGATITYQIEALVSGSATVDGLVITDTIPENTRYVANSLTLDSAPLSDDAGDDAGEASAAGIAVDLGSVPGGTSRNVTFAVLIEE
jgi:uncharacterized repeat protein (TIGR01451 family)